MEQQLSLGKQIKTARLEKNLSQVEFATKCNLNIRTIQRIENDKVDPRLYTLRIIGEILGITLIRKEDVEAESEQLMKFRKVFQRRKQIRIVTFIISIFLLASALILLFSGISKYIWAPYIYIFFFADLIVIGFTWRCPGCNSLLGDFYNIRYCSKCGLNFHDGK